jgi:hypothetical protein
MEQGVTIINGTEPTEIRADSPPRIRSRSISPTRPGTAHPPGTDEPKEKRFLNGWSKEQETLMAEWSDLAMCYRWLHDKSEKHFHDKNLWINLPVIILTTLGGTANFGIQSMFDSDTAKRYASFAIGGISLFAGILTTVGNYLRYAQLEESHRVASIAWGKFQRLIAVELALHPNDRMDSLDFLKICRADLDRLIEQSPPIPEETIKLFDHNFGEVENLKKPEICGALEHTRVFESSQTRLTQVLSDATLMLRHKRRTLNELLSPQIQETIKSQVETRINDAIEERKKTLEAEIELEKAGIREQENEFQRVLEERQKKIQAEIESEIETLKKKQHIDTSLPFRNSSGVLQSSITPSAMMPRRNSNYERRLQLKQNPLFRGITPEKKRTEDSKEIVSLSTPRMSRSGSQNMIVIPSSDQDKPILDIVIHQ